MTQSRFWISTHTNIDKAWSAKHKLEEDNPDKVYQVRKGKNKDEVIFRLVERLKGNEAKVLNESRNPTGYTYRPNKKTRRERGIADILR